MKVALYLRVSSTAQDYERQRDELTALCKYFKYDIVKVFEEKISGAKDERPEFQALCHLTKEDIDGVVVWEISRLGRKLTTVLKVVEDFTEKGITIITKKENFQTLDENGKKTATATIMMSLFATMAEIERENIIERTTSGTRKALNDGTIAYSSKPPYGYKKENKQLVINEDDAATVRNLFRDYLSGSSMAQLEKVYGISNSQISKMFNNPVYIGKPFSNVIGQTMDAPRIIDDRTFYKCEEIRKQRTKERSKVGSVTNPLRGLMKCGCCGRYMVYRGSRWACKQQCFNINSQLLEEVKEELTKTIRSERTKSEDVKTLKERAKNVRNEKKAAILRYASLVQEHNDLKAKLNILAQELSADMLKKEIKALDNIRKKMNKAHQEVITYGEQEERIKNAIETDYSQVNFVDVVEAMVINRVDQRTKVIDVTTKGGQEYKVTAKGYTHEIKIERA